ncbi:MAG: glycosyltransferase family 4 protein [Silvibacterium sp.]|nr:glycosyltransferase family 4 protein [Silvibacterium sp.]
MTYDHTPPAALASSSSHSVPFLIENAWKTIWLTRPDLRSLCQDDPIQLASWLALYGPREYEVLGTPPFPPPLNVLYQPSPAARTDVGPPLTQFLHYLWQNRPDLQQIFPIDTREGQQGFLWWFFFHGVAEWDIARLVTPEQRDFLNQADPAVQQDADSPITRLMLELWRRHPDLQSAFPLASPEGRAGYQGWYRSHGRSVSGLGPLLDEPAARTTRPVRTAPQEGVNLIGFARGEFGIGEDVRMAALSMRAAGIPCTIYNVDPGPQVTQNDRSVDELIGETRPYSTNLFCMTGIDMALLVAKQGPSILEGRRNIGLWPWELPEWPEQWHHAYDLVDELWAASRYTFNAFVKSCPKPVRHVPSAVTVDATDGATRASFELPEDRFLFVFSFDMLASFGRKNPMACIEAFRKAFPRFDEPVGLVVKAMRVVDDHPVWQALLAEAERDNRISIISETLTRGRLLDLYRACDCFVSLHRAEGFGRNLAEAMMLGKPVIATGHSGNLDFTTLSTAALVDYRLTPLTSDDYSFGAGQSWAEPDIGHAAWWMKRLATDGPLCQQLGRQGRIATLVSYSPESVGTSYARILSR